jgi:hypothetical protein
MRLMLAVLILAGLSWPASAPRFHAPVLALEQQSGQAFSGDPIDAKWAVTQGGFFLLILAILWSYRRDFFRRDEMREAKATADLQREREDKAELKQVLRETASSINLQAIAIQRNTDAMGANTQAANQLASDVRLLAERRFEEQRKASS